METSEKIDILLVDDRPDNFTVLKAVLDSPNYNLVYATSGFEAIDMAAKKQFAVILLDVQMPVKDGFETAREIRQKGASKNTPIIFVTAIYSDETYVNLGYDAGAIDYIFKPFNPHILKSKVAVLAELFSKTQKLVNQSELLREVEKKQHANKLLELRIQSIQREHFLQQKYKDLVESIDHCIVWSANLENLNFTFVSPQAEKLLGYKTSEWQNGINFWSKHVHPADVKLVLDSFKIVQSRREYGFEHRIITKDLRALWFHTDVHIATGDDGITQEIRGLSVDITAIKEAEEGQRFLAEAGAHLATTALDYDKVLAKIAELAVPTFASWCGVHVFDENGIIRTVALSNNLPEKNDLVTEFEKKYLTSCSQVNGGMTAVLRTGKPEIISFSNGSIPNSIRQLVADLGIRSYICVPILTREKTLGTITMGSVTKNYKQSDLEIIKELASRAALSIENALLYAKAETAIQTRDEFLSIASHELRTPLTPLKLQVRMIVKLIDEGKFGTITPERLARMMNVSDKQLDRLNVLIEEFLNVSRINLGRMNLDRQHIDLSDLIRNVAEQYKDQLTASSCTLSLDLAHSAEGEWDPAKLEQVIINLLTNSIKYGRGKPIRISVQDYFDSVNVDVQDYGIGIDEKAQEKIFDLFERAPSARNYGGLGLGLFVVSSIVKEHGGTIQVESKLGEGSKFILKLPKKPRVKQLDNVANLTNSKMH